MFGNELHRCFGNVFGSNSALLQQLLNLITPDDARSLRSASPALRSSVNEAVELACCGLDAPGFRVDLADLFPQAHKLKLKLSKQRAVTSMDVCVFLQYVASHTPKLLQKAGSLDIDLAEVMLSKDIASAVTKLLRRCPSLHALSITWKDALADESADDAATQICTVAFTGSGHTPDEQRASMQRQLSDITASPAFLAPDTWPTHNTLTRIKFSHSPTLPLIKNFLPGAVHTSSLTYLDLHCDYPPDAPELTVLSALTTLQKLTNLSLSCGSDLPDPDSVISAIGRLPALACMLVNGCLLGEFDYPTPEGSMVVNQVPAGWSTLPALTELVLDCCTVRLDALPALPKLQLLDMHRGCSTWGSIADLTALTGLTALSDGTSIIPLRADGSEEADDEGSDEEEAGGQGGRRAGGDAATGGGIPPEWQERLVDLEWNFRRRDMPLVAQLSALTRLWLHSARLCPNVLCSLAALPKLAQLELPVAVLRAGYEASECAAAAFRPAFPSLKTLACSSAECLQLLASWTDVPPSLALQIADHIAGPAPQEDEAFVVSVNAWGSGWLPALFTSKPYQNLLLKVPTNYDATNMATALKALAPAGSVATAASSSASPSPSPAAVSTAGANGTPNVSILLGKLITPKVFAVLFQAAGALPRGRLHICEPLEPLPTQVWLEALPKAFYNQLPGITATGLTALQLDNCSNMRDLQLASVLWACPGLKVLHLEEAVLLSDRAAYSLVMCRNLADLQIMGCQKLTIKMVRMLLTMMPALQKVLVEYADALEVMSWLEREAGGDTLGMPVAPRERWLVEALTDSLLQCTARPGSAGVAAV